MFERLRQGPLVRAALLAAGLMAVAASVGLHPEPIGGNRLAAHRGLASAHTDEGAHACPACLTRVAAVLSSPSGLPAAAAVYARLAHFDKFLFPGRLPAGKLSGRSPPLRS